MRTERGEDFETTEISIGYKFLPIMALDWSRNIQAILFRKLTLKQKICKNLEIFLIEMICNRFLSVNNKVFKIVNM